MRRSIRSINAFTSHPFLKSISKNSRLPSGSFSFFSNKKLCKKFVNSFRQAASAKLQPVQPALPSASCSLRLFFPIPAKPPVLQSHCQPSPQSSQKIFDGSAHTPHFSAQHDSRNKGSIRPQQIWERGDILRRASYCSNV